MRKKVKDLDIALNNTAIKWDKAVKKFRKGCDELDCAIDSIKETFENYSQKENVDISNTITSFEELQKSIMEVKNKITTI